VTTVTAASPGTRSTTASWAGSRSASTATANACGEASEARPRQRSKTSSRSYEPRSRQESTLLRPITVKQCVTDWLDSLTLDPVTVAEYRGQAEKWIYPKLGAAKLKDFKATDADRFFKDLGKALGKRSLMMIKSTLRRSIRRAQVQDLIGKNVVELVDLPTGQPGRPSRAMTEEQAGRCSRSRSAGIPRS